MDDVMGSEHPVEAIQAIQQIQQVVQEDLAHSGGLPEVPVVPQDKNQIPCELCPKKFNGEVRLAKHLVSYHGAVGLQAEAAPRPRPSRHKPCTECGRVITNRIFFVAHMFREHHVRLPGLTEYPCSFCDKVFYVKRSFVSHMNGHTGVRNHKCDLCEYTSNYDSNVRIHRMRVHRDGANAGEPSPGRKRGRKRKAE